MKILVISLISLIAIATIATAQESIVLLRRVHVLYDTRLEELAVIEFTATIKDKGTFNCHLRRFVDPRLRASYLIAYKPQRSFRFHASVLFVSLLFNNIGDINF